jgi:hypothetical protein
MRNIQPGRPTKRPEYCTQKAWTVWLQRRRKEAAEGKVKRIMRTELEEIMAMQDRKEEK